MNNNNLNNTCGINNKNAIKLHEFISESPKWSDEYDNISLEDVIKFWDILLRDSALQHDYREHVRGNITDLNKRIKYITDDVKEAQRLQKDYIKSKEELKRLYDDQEKRRKQHAEAMGDLINKIANARISNNLDVYVCCVYDNLNSTTKTKICIDFMRYKESSDYAAEQKKENAKEWTIDTYFEEKWIPSQADEYKQNKRDWVAKYIERKVVKK